MDRDTPHIVWTTAYERIPELLAPPTSNEPLESE